MIHRGSHEVITIGQNLSFVFLMVTHATKVIEVYTIKTLFPDVISDP